MRVCLCVNVQHLGLWCPVELSAEQGALCLSTCCTTMDAAPWDDGWTMVLVLGLCREAGAMVGAAAVKQL